MKFDSKDRQTGARVEINNMLFNSQNVILPQSMVSGEIRMIKILTAATDISTVCPCMRVATLCTCIFILLMLYVETNDMCWTCMEPVLPVFVHVHVQLLVKIFYIICSIKSEYTN